MRTRWILAADVAAILVLAEATRELVAFAADRTTDGPTTSGSTFRCRRTDAVICVV